MFLMLRKLLIFAILKLFFIPTGIIDGSGLRIYYTPKLRQYDAGTLMIGAAVSPRSFIPPRQKEYIVTGHGNPECLVIFLVYFYE